MAISETSLEQRLAYLDCQSGIALALALRRGNQLTDAEFALLRQAFQEVALLAQNNQFRIDSKGVVHTVDSYLSDKLKSLAVKFNATRHNEARLKLDACLLLREQILAIINLLIQIATALKGIKTTASIEAYDKTLVQACLREIEGLKNLYTLVNCFPIDTVLAKDFIKYGSDYAKSLGINQKSKKSKGADYRIENMQSFLLHQLVNASSTTVSLMNDLQSLSNESLPKIAAAERKTADITDILTDCFEKALSAGRKNAQENTRESLPPLLKGIATFTDGLEAFLSSILPLPKQDPLPKPSYAEIEQAIASEKNWHRYRQKQLEKLSGLLIG